MSKEIGYRDNRHIRPWCPYGWSPYDKPPTPREKHDAEEEARRQDEDSLRRAEEKSDD